MSIVNLWLKYWFLKSTGPQMVGFEYGRRLKTAPPVWELQYCKWHLNLSIHKKKGLTLIVGIMMTWKWCHNEKCRPLAGLPGRSHHTLKYKCMRSWGPGHLAVGLLYFFTINVLIVFHISDAIFKIIIQDYTRFSSTFFNVFKVLMVPFCGKGLNFKLRLDISNQDTKMVPTS